ncbi:RNA polymerase sigma factor FliA [Caloramator mitchellensis]|uniref:RNA polymerase sigma factor FliA n=1 Tax=Caloramator mitchellensis TaxID=908809 RepID=A0A0R3JWA4_CALMK|nr:sigma-70 family RNA polymerase sigma factor [Caloramator mitchellensis]KRQ87835.1 RNA polymerase sigma factor FliA [Caloramator mitchellensis]
MRDLVLEARKDDEKKILILKKFEPLLKKCFSMYVKDKEYFEDAMQEGRVAILKCINNFKVDANVPFEAYVKRAVINSMRDFVRRIKFDYMSLEFEMTEDGSLMHEVIPSDVCIEEDMVKKEENRDLYDAIENLSPKQREVIIDYYFKRKSMVEISNNRRCHYMSVARLKDRAIDRIREEMERKE